MREPQRLPRRRRRPRMQSRFAQTLILAFSQWEREEEREAIRRLNPAIPEEVVSCLSWNPFRDRRFWLALARPAPSGGENFKRPAMQRADQQA